MSTFFRRSAFGASLAVAAITGFGFNASQALATPPPPPPSACGISGSSGTIAQADSTAGHTHYRVTLTANEGTSACTLSGWAVEPTFFLGKSPVDVQPQPYGQPEDVAFGPGSPVHFDVQVPNSGGADPADRVIFELPELDGPAGTNGWAVGDIAVGAGTQIGPIQPGA
ncbi:hypothetical protein OU415_17890 [Saccharopolyspora sp. WRP15-2]|uniref:DUF4232 domain-containing protein n=1 Tax=Saccharopolyspora oryzae TaxID=2997343 RepID=A0ABT4V023_9PSEU|nr:DUF4232 domain-containing protein [Saccharopolyspora oryzae]MDA3627323.1 hypothetical protein [Saccharopolyspora oryzae]